MYIENTKMPPRIAKRETCLGQRQSIERSFSDEARAQREHSRVKLGHKASDCKRFLSLEGDCGTIHLSRGRLQAFSLSCRPRVVLSLISGEAMVQTCSGCRLVFGQPDLGKIRAKKKQKQGQGELKLGKHLQKHKIIISIDYFVDKFVW